MIQICYFLLPENEYMLTSGNIQRLIVRTLTKWIQGVSDGFQAVPAKRLLPVPAVKYSQQLS